MGKSICIIPCCINLQISCRILPSHLFGTVCPLFVSTAYVSDLHAIKVAPYVIGYLLDSLEVAADVNLHQDTRYSLLYLFSC